MARYTMLKRAVLLFLLFVFFLSADVESAVHNPTATQAILVYTAPDEMPCTLQVSESETLAPLVPDIDPTLFPGSNLDNRDGNITEKRFRYFVIGKRTAEKAADGKRYSRALQAFTKHYYRLTCGDEAGTGSFTTANPPLGDTAPDLPPFDPEAFGNWGWPSLEPEDRTQKVVDPLTGILIRRLTLAGDRRNVTRNSKFHFVLNPGGKWADAANALSGAPDLLASYSGPGQEPLFLGLDPARFRPEYRDFGGWAPGWSLDDLAIRAFGAGTEPEEANRTVDVCLSLDSGATCAGNPVEMVLPQSNGDALPVPGGWRNLLVKGEFGPRRGNVKTDGRSVSLTSPAAASFFPQNLSPGARIRIAGTHPACPDDYCTVAAVRNATELTLVEDIGVREKAEYSAANAGLRVVKKTAAGSVSVSFSFDYADSAEFVMPGYGGTEMCSRNAAETAVDAAGQPLPDGGKLSGNLCVVQTATNESALYFVIPETGEARLISTFFGEPDPNEPMADRLVGSGIQPVRGDSFDPVDPRVLYFSAPVNGPDGQRRRSIFRLTYTGDFREYKPEPGARRPPDDKTVRENLAPASQGRDVQSQAAAARPDLDPSIWAISVMNGGLGMVGEYFVFSQGPGSPQYPYGPQDAPCALYFFDVKSERYAKLAKVADSFSSPSLRWGGCHTVSTGFADWLRLMPKVIGADGSNRNAVFGGAHMFPITAVRKNGRWSGDTSLAEDYSEACPADLDPKWKALGATGRQCVFLRIRGDACNYIPNTVAGENARYPCPWDPEKSMLQPLAEGDWFSDAARHDSEKMRIVRKRALPLGAGYEVVAQRFVRCQTTAKANGWSGMVGPTGACRATNSVLRASDPVGEWLMEDSSVAASHNDLGSGVTPGRITAVMASYNVRYDGAVPESIGKPADIVIDSAKSSFEGVTGAAAKTQSYPSKRQWNAPASEQVWVADLRHLNPSSGAVSESAGSMIERNTATLVEGTNQVYLVEPAGGKPDVKRAPLFAYAGRYLLKEKSGPARGNTLTDADEWRFCVARVDRECRAGSKAGQVFMNVPQADLAGGCFTNQYARNIPCVLTLPPYGGWAVQWDVSRDDPKGVNFRRLSMALSGPGRQYHYGNIRPTPEGKWALAPGYWLDGLRNDVLLLKLPPWPAEEKQPDRSVYQKVRIKLPAVEGFTSARVRFGYAEYGRPGDFHCTPRQDACSTGGEPFAWESEKPVWTRCVGGCEIVVPAYAGRVLYYVVDRKSADGRTEKGKPQVMIVP